MNFARSAYTDRLKGDGISIMCKAYRADTITGQGKDRHLRLRTRFALLILK